MRIRQTFLPVVFALLALALTVPAFSANKDMIQLQTQVQAIQDQLARLQQSIDERMGVMRNLVEQSTDNVNRVGTSVGELQKVLQQQHGDAGTRADQLSGQMQSLNDSVDELKARMAKLGKQLDDIQTTQQNLAAPPVGQAPATGGLSTPGLSAPGQPEAQAPPPDILYNNALRDYNGNNTQLAVQEFSDYVKFYPNTDLAGNALFYLAEIQYRGGNFEQAVKNYDEVLEQFPGGNKAAASQLKKGYALLELGDRAGGTRELNALITRYPRTIEAQQARDRLKKLGAAAPATRANKRPAE